MPMVIDELTYYRTSEACQIAGVSRSTFFRWLKMGILEDVPRKDRRGWRLFTENDVGRIKAEANKIRKDIVHEASAGGKNELSIIRAQTLD